GVRFERPIVQAYARARGSEGGNTAGHVGNQILSRFRVIFDCPHRQMFLAPNAHRDLPFDLDMSGMTFDPGFTILSVSAGSGAEAAGLKPRDRILTIDGAPVEKLGFLGARDALKRDGVTCEVEVLRGGEKVRAQVLLKRRF